MPTISTVLALLASVAVALAMHGAFPHSARAQSPQPAGSVTSGYSIFRVPQPLAKGSLFGGTTATASTPAKATPPAARVPFPVSPKTSSAKATAGAKGATTQTSPASTETYVHPSKRQKTRRMPLGW